MKRIVLSALGILFLSFLSVGCIRRPIENGSQFTWSESQKYEALKTLDVDMKIGVGELKIGGDSKDIFQGNFIYQPERWKPEVNYNSMGSQGNLSIYQPSKMKGINLKHYKYLWDITLNNEPSINLNLKLGVGKSHLILGTLNLDKVDIEMGVGEAEIDLRGKWEKDVEISIQGGVGKTTVLLPENMGVVAKIDKGIGEISANGLNKSDNVYTNELYSDDNPTLKIDMEAGIGQIELR